MFNNDLMADVHFVVGPPGGTQRLPGHKVSNRCITRLVLRFTKRDPLREPGTWGGQLANGRQCVFHPITEKAQRLQRALATLNFFLCFLLPCFMSQTKTCPLNSTVMGSCCDRLGKSYVSPSPRNQLDKLLFYLFYNEGTWASVC